MKAFFSKAGDLAGHIREYAENKVEYAELTAAEKTSKIVATIAAVMITGLFCMFFLIFATIALALALGTLIGNAVVGFTIMSGIYLITCAIIWFGRHRLIRLPLLKSLLKIFNLPYGKNRKS